MIEAVGIFIAVAIGIAVAAVAIILWGAKVWYCPSCGNAITNPYEETYEAAGRTFHVVKRTCPIYRDQREPGWPTHYSEVVKQYASPPAFDPYTGKERQK